MYGSTPPPKKSSFVHKLHIQHLAAQRDHVHLLQNYVKAMNHARDPELAAMYHNLADLLEKTAEQYSMLIDRLQRSDGNR